MLWPKFPFWIQTFVFNILLINVLDGFKKATLFILLVLNIAPGNVIGCHPVSEVWEKMLRILLESYRLSSPFSVGAFLWVQGLSKLQGNKDFTGV